jgi:hypothetical protein
MTSSKPTSIRPSVAYIVAGDVNTAGKIYLETESVRPGIKHCSNSTVPAPAERVGKCAFGCFSAVRAASFRPAVLIPVR